MVSRQNVNEQLKRIGADFRFWGRAEIKELPKILFDNETIMHVMNGRYENGFAVLCATNHRLLLIDKKPLFLFLEDARYEMIAEVDFSHQLLSAELFLRLPTKTLKFISFKPGVLRNLTTFVQQRVMELRFHQGHQEQLTQASPSRFPIQQVPFSQQIITNNQPTVLSSLTPGYPRNPYTNTPFLMRRRVPKFYNQQ